MNSRDMRTYKKISYQDVQGLEKSGIAFVLFERKGKDVTREVALDFDGNPLILYPSARCKEQFRGFFDGRPVENSFGSAISKSRFELVWKRAEEMERLGLLRSSF